MFCFLCFSLSLPFCFVFILNLLPRKFISFLSVLSLFLSFSLSLTHYLSLSLQSSRSLCISLSVFLSIPFSLSLFLSTVVADINAPRLLLRALSRAGRVLSLGAVFLSIKYHGSCLLLSLPALCHGRSLYTGTGSFFFIVYFNQKQNKTKKIRKQKKEIGSCMVFVFFPLYIQCITYSHVYCFVIFVAIFLLHFIVFFKCFP